jgi:hypothetical protein
MALMRKTLTAGFILAVFLSAAVIVDSFFFGGHHLERLRAHHLLRRESWSIGIYEGDTPFHLVRRVGNPVLRARDVTDTAARMVADPFAVLKDGVWHLFFEVDSVSTRQGEIGLATSTDLVHWNYRQIVLDEPFHLSFPQVFEYDESFYMIPESIQAGSIRLYRADPFPTRWIFVADLIEGAHKDPVLLRHAGRWWLFSCTGQNENMNIFYADRLTGPWVAHAENPVIQNDRSRARAAGGICRIGKRLFRFAQDCTVRYGHRVLAFEIQTLTPEEYAETPLEQNPVLEPSGHGWNAARMHQLDLHRTDSGRWIGFADGNPR